MKSINDSLDDILAMIRKLDEKLDIVIEKNSPPEDVKELFKKIKEENAVTHYK